MGSGLLLQKGSNGGKALLQFGDADTLGFQFGFNPWLSASAAPSASTAAMYHSSGAQAEGSVEILGIGPAQGVAAMEAGCPTRIRTWTKGSKDPCATFTPSDRTAENLVIAEQGAKDFFA